MTRLTPLVLAAALAIAPLGGCASLLGQAQAEPAGPVALSPEEAALLGEANAVRQAHGLPALAADAKLVAIARARSRDMAKRGYFDHVTPEGRSVFGIMRDNKVAFVAAGENLAKDVHSAADAPKAIMARWAKTPAHRTNLLGAGFGRVGIGAIRSVDGQTVVVTGIFAD